MDLITSLALAGGSAWASGLRLYLTLFVIGGVHAADWVELPTALAVLADERVLWVTGLLALIEFAADKIAFVDSLWDATQSLLRVPAGALLSYGVFADSAPAVQFSAALLGAALTASVHATKAGARAAVNSSPEPFSNVATSVGEDVLHLSMLALVFAYPWVFLCLLVLMILVMAWLLPKLWRFVSGLYALATRGWSRLRGAPA